VGGGWLAVAVSRTESAWSGPCGRDVRAPVTRGRGDQNFRHYRTAWLMWGAGGWPWPSAERSQLGADPVAATFVHRYQGP